MNLILFIAVVLVVLTLVIYGFSLLPMIGSPFKELLMFLAVVVAILAIVNRAGWM